MIRNFLDCVDIVGKSPERFNDVKKYVSTGAVNFNKIDEKQVEFVNYEDKPSRANLEAESGDILFAKMQNTTKTLKIDEINQNYIFSTGFFAVRPRKQVISHSCLYHILCSEYFLQQKDKNCSGATQKAITNSGLTKININIPDTDIQDAITAQLDKIDFLSCVRRKQLEKLEELVKSRFIELFGDPINPKKRRILGDIALLERGRFSPRPRNDPKYYNGEYPFIQTGDIANSGHRLSKYKQTLNDDGIKVSKKFSPGTIVIAIVGATIGATAILEREVYAPDSIIGITVNNSQYDAIFLETLLQFWQPELHRIAPESARANINLAILNNIPIIDVGITKQKEFVEFIKKVDETKYEVHKSIEKLETLKNVLMQKYFG